MDGCAVDQDNVQARYVTLAATPIVVGLMPGGTVHCEAGKGWVTLESNDPGRAHVDHVVLPGQPFLLPEGGRIILSALQGTARLRLTGAPQATNE